MSATIFTGRIPRGVSACTPTVKKLKVTLNKAPKPTPQKLRELRATLENSIELKNLTC